MKKILMPLAMLAFAHLAFAADANDYRGGWETDVATSGSHIYDFSIRGDQVRGIYCAICNDATTLAFVDGKLGDNGLTFVVTHVRDDGSTTYRDHATARFDHGQLVVQGTSGAPGGGKFEWTMHKDPRGPAPLPVPVNKLPPGPPVPAEPFPVGGRRPPPYIQPGPWEQLTPAKVVGVWLGFGAGIDKQFFIIRRFGNRLRGMVCGRCDNPYTMAALDDFRIDGDTLHFNILHEDWGPGSLPFHNQVTAHVSQNEMRITTQPDNRAPPPPGRAVFGGTSLMGPVSLEATRRGGE
ncbi:MAG TPA: hypothetical protein VHX52_06160 [Steroidobacteraceae bacterium]|nr:hypothetical protein [Steroidobacteraceae bacterium]